ncbi:hypothetical protein ASE16_10520 [Leifsonia sp. Root227]|uniref:GNAT family N-acetyltransferase n=1 Tax=Leifsonia sp. Root227 TaxID=1736496 RepID=UPI0006F3594E|nr:GNAT family N-acetyltransferase [Leifsonia sp. Root227]KRC49203.1 hypothetical protein ASE16_10520 [Leifsonia sp. Root227]
MRTFETDRLALRGWEAADADFAFDLYSRWEVQRYIGREPKVMTDPAQAVALIERLRGHEHPVHGYWVVVERETGAQVGTVLLKAIPASVGVERDDTEIGWHFHPDAWGHGYATEAAAIVLRHALDSGIDEVVAVTAPDNVASQGVCLRLGMHAHGLSDRYYDVTCALYSTRA